MGLEEAREIYWSRHRIDVNGDGVKDLMLAWGGYCGSGGCVWHLYRCGQGGDCATWLGTLRGRFYEATGERHRGYAELLLGRHSGSCDVEKVRYRFDGQAYSPYTVRNCRCVPLEVKRLPSGKEVYARPGADRGCTPWRQP